MVGISSGSAGVTGSSTSGNGVYGASSSGNGVVGNSTNGNGVVGISSSGLAGSFSGNVNATGTVCASNINCASDVRLKQNIRPLGYGLKEVLNLRPVKWEWKGKTTKQLSLGLTAQEVEPVLPELILRNVDTKGSLGLNYMGLIPVLVKGIQEQQAEVDRLQKEIKQLKVQMRQLQAERRGNRRK